MSPITVGLLVSLILGKHWQTFSLYDFYYNFQDNNHFELLLKGYITGYIMVLRLVTKFIRAPKKLLLADKLI
jgi:hypothetical protein